VLLISGEGGAGKTSLACQIAQWGLTKQPLYNVLFGNTHINQAVGHAGRLKH
jgi:anion-transporting  ArsA/GET3 family ATPase